MSLPGLHDWESYMSLSKIESFPAASDESFLANYELGRLFLSGKGGELREFRDNSRAFLDSLVSHLLSLVFA